MSEPDEPVLVPQRRSDRAVAIFVEEVSALLEGLSADPSELIRLVHAIRGGCASIGAQRMMLRCATLERRARAGDSVDLALELQRLREVFADTRAAMLAERAQGCKE